MTTTDLIAILQKLERGGATGRSRELSIRIGDKLYANVDLKFSSAGDGCAGAELCLEMTAERVYE